MTMRLRSGSWRQLFLRPGLLGGGGAVEDALLAGGVREMPAHPVHQPEGEVRRHAPEKDRYGWVPDDPVHQPAGPVLFREAVAVDGMDRHAAQLEPESAGAESDAGLAVPERVAPTVMVAAGHQDRDATAQRGQRAGDPEACARNGSAIGEPEVEQVAVDQQAVAKRGYGIEERQHRLVDRRPVPPPGGRRRR